LIVAGMWVQAVGLFLTAATHRFAWWFLASVLLGLGTAMVYPTLIASVSDASHPSAIAAIGALTFASGTVVAVVMNERRQTDRANNKP
jgi:MFS family permease